MSSRVINEGRDRRNCYRRSANCAVSELILFNFKIKNVFIRNV